MDLNLELVRSMGATQQMTVGRLFDRYCRIEAKPEKNGSDLVDLEKLKAYLLPYSTEAATSTDPGKPLAQQRAEQFGAENRGIVLNVQKVAAAGLNGAAELALHRDSAALGRLLGKPVESLSVGEAQQLASLKSRLVRFVGPVDRLGHDGDFRVAA
jgi:hypothetical protein